MGAGDDLETEHRPRGPVTERDPNARPCLQVLSGPEAGRLFVLPPGPSIIGRGAKAEVRIDESGVSREHAKLIVGDDVINLVDLGSTNGTFLDGAPIDAAIVRDGNRIHVGPDVALRFVYLDPAQATAPPSTSPGPGDPGPASPPSPAAVPLSAREREVAVLVAEGLSNPQIGRRLFISPRTVTTHLVTIYARLEIHSRAALTRYVLEHGLHERE
ncbi:MAG: FHA domain-containing protein [Myxococcales bacterium]|nr:FHA domain-containing protein [Myxococcales bacterium]